MKNLLILLITVTFISCGQTTREFDLNVNDKNLKYEDNNVFSYITDGEITNIILYKDTPFTGTIGDYDSSDEYVIQITTFKDGKKDGLEKKFFKNGNIDEKIMYKI
tara:strand:+ start:32 stop:349 length:318 start_codon:yes stop_codon:yes gene_type:complete